MDGVYVFGNRIARLQEAQERQRAYVNDPEHYNFRIAVSCPPDTQIHMRGGLMYQYRDSGDGWFVEPATIDLTDPAQTFNKTYTFTGAGNYLGYIIRFVYGGEYGTPYTFHIAGSDTEYTVAAGAENSILNYAEVTNYTWYSHYPLCGLVLRNNGVLGTGYNILPIDRVNRGRSYIWPADMRPRNIAL